MGVSDFMFTARSTPEAIIRGMEPWLEKRGQACEVRNRTVEQEAWDSAVLACSEYLRRRLNYDETLSMELHGLCVPRYAAPERPRP